MPRAPKKSEIIEIRVSHETKEAIKTRARREGRTVSDVLRQLIEGYLHKDEKGTVFENLKENIMSQVRNLQRRPRMALASLSSLLVMGAAVVMLPARAQDIDVAVKTEFTTSQDGVPSRSTSNAKVRASYGKEVEIDMVGAGGPTPRRLVLTAEPLEDGSVRLNMTLYEGRGEDARVIAKPVVTMAKGSDATVKAGQADEDGTMTDGFTIEVNVSDV